MRLLHAAALAFVGWYLMVPPQSQVDSGAIDHPVKSFVGWARNKKEFQNEEACLGQQGLLIGFLKQEPNTNNYPRSPIGYGECASSTDPRLQGSNPPVWRFDPRRNRVIFEATTQSN